MSSSALTRPFDAHAPLYDTALEHDACGVGFVADMHGRSRADVIGLALTALQRLAHRGPAQELGIVDGCGVLTGIPWRLFGVEGGLHVLGMLFVSPGGSGPAAAIVERELHGAGVRRFEWRLVPVDPSAVPRAHRAAAPEIVQVIGEFDDHEGRDPEAALFAARQRIERSAREGGLSLTVVSLSTRTVTYKALVAPQALSTFYRDLSDERYSTTFAIFHQRFSTNTHADWALAQPFRHLAHNGEINTITGNRRLMLARLADRGSIRGLESGQAVATDGSDSQTLDDVLALQLQRGFSAAHAISRLVPPAWEADTAMPADLRAFYEFESLVSEPWDGPAALAFTDGRTVGAALDRNGFRPARTATTHDGLIVVASEAGVLAADAYEIASRDRLEPGGMISVDVLRGGVKLTGDIRRQLASARPFAMLVARATLDVPPPSWPSPPTAADPLLRRRQAAFGYSREEIDLLLKPMAGAGEESVGSMGDDGAPAMLADRPRLFFDYFRQRFAQVTNPAIDPYREAAAMSLASRVGAHGPYLEEYGSRPLRARLSSPVLAPSQLAALRTMRELRPVVVPLTFEAIGGDAGFARAFDRVVEAAVTAVRRRASLVILSDDGVDETYAAVPSLLATAAVHQALIDAGLRMRAGLVVSAGDVRDPHQLAALCAYGASAVCPTLGFDTVVDLLPGDGEAPARYRGTLERGLRRIMSKMGVCTFAGYCGAQLFEVLGLDGDLVDRWFPGTPGLRGGATLADLGSAVLERHRQAFGRDEPVLQYPGVHTFRRGGEPHAMSPVVVRRLHDASVGGAARYREFASLVYDMPPVTIRDLMEIVPAEEACPLDAVESAERIAARMFASAMSVGALSPEAHRTIAIAMNRLGARSNSGEGGEDAERFERPVQGDWSGNRTKQVASARFGVTPAYLRSADELQIKIAQGSKPGEGGQLPAIKVSPQIAALRYAQPGATLISPPVHHDIYSIEDLAQLIEDLRAVNPTARINVKLVASSGVGIIAVGVAKAGADAIQISGHSGGTGASPRASIKHVGLPWEIGLAEAHQMLTRAGLRDRVVLQVDGGLKTGRDIVIAAALGAEEFGFGTAALVAIGCVMARQCHANTCPVGIATQRPDLRRQFKGTPEMLVDYLMLLAGEVRELLAACGVTRLGELVGRADRLRPRADQPSSLTTVIRPLLSPLPLLPSLAARDERAVRPAKRASAAARLEDAAIAAVQAGPSVVLAGPIGNTDRTFGARTAGEAVARFGDAGVPDGRIQWTLTGTAGQSFGAFLVPGLRLTLVGDANDYVGKGMRGGEIAITPPPAERWRRDVLAGNTVLYGATGGRLFIAGSVGDRFAVRNSGATAVVEGAGDHACEYMTGGTIVILGPVGRNFGAGMSGGLAYVYDKDGSLTRRCNPDMVACRPLTVDERHALRMLLAAHELATGSPRARQLQHEAGLAGFVAVAPFVQKMREASDKMRQIGVIPQ